jgi:hypothetical protein
MKIGEFLPGIPPLGLSFPRRRESRFVPLLRVSLDTRFRGYDETRRPLRSADHLRTLIFEGVRKARRDRNWTRDKFTIEFSKRPIG